MSRQSVAKAHQKIQELSWEPLYPEPVSQYGTDYTFKKAQKKDPLKQVLRGIGQVGRCIAADLNGAAQCSRDRR